MTNDFNTRVVQIQAELAAMAASQPAGLQQRALERATSWLGNITAPLTDKEQDGWGAIADEYCDSIEATDIPETMTTADMRDAIDTMQD